MTKGTRIAVIASQIPLLAYFGSITGYSVIAVVMMIAFVFLAVMIAIEPTKRS